MAAHENHARLVQRLKRHRHQVSVHLGALSIDRRPRPQAIQIQLGPQRRGGTHFLPGSAHTQPAQFDNIHPHTVYLYSICVSAGPAGECGEARVLPSCAQIISSP